MARSDPSGHPTPRPTATSASVTRKVDTSGSVCFAGSCYRVGNPFKRRQVQVAVVGDTVEISIGEEPPHPPRQPRPHPPARRPGQPRRPPPGSTPPRTRPRLEHTYQTRSGTRVPPDRCAPGQIERRTHDDKRHGVTDLFASRSTSPPTASSWMNLVERLPPTRSSTASRNTQQTSNRRRAIAALAVELDDPAGRRHRHPDSGVGGGDSSATSQAISDVTDPYSRPRHCRLQGRVHCPGASTGLL